MNCTYRNKKGWKRIKMVLSYLEGVTKERNAYSLLVKAHDEKMNQSLT